MRNLTPLPQQEVRSIEFSELSFGYDNTAPLLDHVNFKFPDNKVLLFSGKEGAGVSTLFRILAGLKNPISGSYLLNEKNYFGLSDQDRVQAQLSIGYSFAHGGLLSNYTLLDNLVLPLDYHRLEAPKDRRVRALAYLEYFQIAEYANLLPAFATAAARKASVLIRAFLLCPRLVLLDEPTQGLHKAGIARLGDMIQWHQQSMGLSRVYLSTEDDGLLSRFSVQNVLLQNKGLQNGV